MAPRRTTKSTRSKVADDLAPAAEAEPDSSETPAPVSDEPQLDGPEDRDPDPEEAVADPGAATEVSPPDGPIVVFKRWPLIVCALLAAVGFAGTGYFGRYWLNARSTSNQDNQVRTATSQFVSALTTFNAGNIDSDFARIQSLATGTFATQARQVFGSSIRNQLIAAGAGSRGQIRYLYIESDGGGQATVFVVVDQVYITQKLTAPVSDTLRLEIGLNDTTVGWRVSSVNVLQSPSGFTPTAPGGTTSPTTTTAPPKPK